MSRHDAHVRKSLLLSSTDPPPPCIRERDLVVVNFWLPGLEGMVVTNMTSAALLRAVHKCHTCIMEGSSCGRFCGGKLYVLVYFCLALAGTDSCALEAAPPTTDGFEPVVSKDSRKY